MAQTMTMIGATMENGMRKIAANSGTVESTTIRLTTLPRYMLAIRPQTKSGRSTNRVGPGVSPQIINPPIITACEWIEGTDLPRVALDNAAGTELATRHLLELGHSRIGYIGGPTANVLNRTRIEGIRRVIGDDFTGFPGDFSLDAGRFAAGMWSALPPAMRPTGIVSFSDEMACAFIAELQRQGFQVPRDLSVVGFDDIELVSHLAPALTTIRQPKREIGRIAAQTMLAVIEGHEVPLETMVPPLLMTRASTGPAPKIV